MGATMQMYVVLISLPLFELIRRVFDQKVEQMDGDAITPSNFTIMG
jgi:hypothetical protein